MQSYVNSRLATAVDHNPQFVCRDGMGEDTSDLEGIFG